MEKELPSSDSAARMRTISPLEDPLPVDVETARDAREDHASHVAEREEVEETEERF